MGLDTTHGCWHGSYPSFARWRQNVAERAGYSLGKREDGWVVVLLDWDQFKAENYQGQWDEPPKDPLLFLIVHSDCDGVIHPQHAAPLADRLQEIVDGIPESELTNSHNAFLRMDTKRFIAGLRSAIAANEDVEFG